MQKVGSSILLSASDLVGHLHCRHLTALDVEVANGRLEKPEYWDPFQEILQERGAATKRGISKGAFRSGDWVGRTDVLLRVETPAALGPWAYEVVDANSHAKRARERGHRLRALNSKRPPGRWRPSFRSLAPVLPRSHLSGPLLIVGPP